ncbi:DUF6894 family protein [Sphingomonas natans]|uniref:DUF6894 family protein n=1 Tax=Sphingomonas natans TaxID=3063330 RepID=UPI0026E1BB1B|nr:hypothetical protein [Sphingomonas sp. BIUV-7]
MLNDTSYQEDEVGVDLDGPDAADRYARLAIADITSDELKQGRSPIHLTISVESAAGELVARYRLVTSLEVGKSPFDGGLVG